MLLGKQPGSLFRLLRGALFPCSGVHEAAKQEATKLVILTGRSSSGYSSASSSTSSLNELIVPEDKKLNAIWSSGYSCNPNTTAVDLPKEVVRFVIPPDAHQRFPWGDIVHHPQRGKFNPMIPWVDASIENMLGDLDEPEKKASAQESVVKSEMENEKMECIKRPYQPNVLKRKRQSGFLVRLRSRTGRKILQRRRKKGRRRLSA